VLKDISVSVINARNIFFILFPLGINTQCKIKNNTPTVERLKTGQERIKQFQEESCWKKIFKNILGKNFSELFPATDLLEHCESDDGEISLE